MQDGKYFFFSFCGAISRGEREKKKQGTSQVPAQQAENQVQIDGRFSSQTLPAKRSRNWSAR